MKHGCKQKPHNGWVLIWNNIAYVQLLSGACLHQIDHSFVQLLQFRVMATVYLSSVGSFSKMRWATRLALPATVLQHTNVYDQILLCIQEHDDPCCWQCVVSFTCILQARPSPWQQRSKGSQACLCDGFTDQVQPFVRITSLSLVLQSSKVQRDTDVCTNCWAPFRRSRPRAS